jgi:hypothetical protein
MACEAVLEIHVCGGLTGDADVERLADRTDAIAAAIVSELNVIARPAVCSVRRSAGAPNPERAASSR